MKRDFILDEAEYSIASNKLRNGSGQLSDSVNRYIAILTTVQTEGIKDEKINHELSEIMKIAKNYQKQILAINEKLRKEIINPKLSEVEAKDKFDFPFSFMDIVTKLLRRFL